MTQPHVGHLLARIISLSSTLHKKAPHEMAEDLSKITADVGIVVNYVATQNQNLTTVQGLLATAENANSTLTVANAALSAQVAALQAQIAAQPADNQPAIDALVAQLAPIVAAASGANQTPPAPNSATQTPGGASVAAGTDATAAASAPPSATNPAATVPSGDLATAAAGADSQPAAGSLVTPTPQPVE